MQEHQKVEAVLALYFNGLVETWYHSLVLSKGLVNWVDFKEELISRFEDELLDDIVEQFNRLVQTGLVDEFLGKFEDLKVQMLVRNPHLNDAHFLSSFMGALKEEIRFAVKMFKPTTLKLAIEKTRMQEQAFEVVQRRNKITTKPATAMSHNSFSKALGSSASRPNAFKLSPEFYEYTKSNRLCFQCGEKYTVGLQCRPKQLNCLTRGVETAEGLSAEVEDPTYMDRTIEGDIEHEVQEAVCLNALTGSIQGVNTILVSGTVKNMSLTLLIDSGSTHSYIDQQSHQRRSFQGVNTILVSGTVKNMSFTLLIDSGSSHSFIDQHSHRIRSFQEHLLIIPLGGCDLVLGNDWMKKYYPTKFDHEKKCLTMCKKGNKLIFKGITEEGRLNMTPSGAMNIILKKGHALIANLFMLSTEVQSDHEVVDKTIQDVLDRYLVVFEEPKSLTHIRELDHGIPLKKSVVTITLRPYRYNYYQNNESKKQVIEMLNQGIVQPSQSPFSSPTLLVKKKDCSWRLCVDYRGLNDITIKDKYPIPIVDDLLEESHGSVIFSKVDLRAG
ncbi:hypothetical protein KY289_001453 [Solanum tuberosum]|nr:hypothetical protein KY289_001453 [Solanum tuberosum]